MDSLLYMLNIYNIFNAVSVLYIYAYYCLPSKYICSTQNSLASCISTYSLVTQRLHKFARCVLLDYLPYIVGGLKACFYILIG